MTCINFINKFDKLTYDEISKIYNISPNKVHNIVKNAYNKMVNYYVDVLQFNIFDVVLFLSKFLGITEKEAFEKLDKKNKIRLKKEVLQKIENKEKEDE